MGRAAALLPVMKPLETFVDVRDLEVGMYIHLDLGWMSHPFPLSSFRLSAPEQISTLRSLGLTRVRWMPERSDARFRGDTSSAPALVPAPAAGAPAAPVAVAADAPHAAARQQRQRQLSTQREALQRCERRYADAGRECRALFDLAGAQPVQARQRGEALVDVVIDEMLGAEGDLTIRLLGEGAGDKASLHALNVSIISLLMARVFGLGAEELRDLGLGALMHDVGKIQVPERLRHRSEQFTPSELACYQEHVDLGVAIGRRMGLAPAVLAVIEQHHEHADGSGFPRGLGSERMSVAARIVALVDRYDYLCNPASPAKALTPHEALAQLFSQGKSQFDTAIMAAFIKMMGVYPPGSAVQLTDDRYALVSAVNSSRPLKPRVLVYDPAVPPDEALLLDLQHEPGLGIRRSLRPLALPRPALDYLSPRPRTAYYFEPARVHESRQAAAA